MLDFDELKEKVSDFIHEKPLAFGISALILVFFVLALIVIFIQSSKPAPEEYKKEVYTSIEKPIAPSGPDIEKDYYMSRTTKSEWSEEELKEYLPENDSGLIEELNDTNNKIIDEILGAAP